MPSRLGTWDKLPALTQRGFMLCCMVKQVQTVSTNGTEQTNLQWMQGGLAFSVLSLSQKAQYIRVPLFIKAIKLKQLSHGVLKHRASHNMTGRLQVTVAEAHTDTTRLIQTSRKQLYPSLSNSKPCCFRCLVWFFLKSEMVSQQKNHQVFLNPWPLFLYLIYLAWRDSFCKESRCESLKASVLMSCNTDPAKGLFRVSSML